MMIGLDKTFRTFHPTNLSLELSKRKGKEGSEDEKKEKEREE